MKKNKRVTLKLIASGITGVILFLLLIFILNDQKPQSDHIDVVDGWVVAFVYVVSITLSMVLAGALSVLLTFNDFNPSSYSLASPLISGIICGLTTLILPLILGVYLNNYDVPGLFVLGLMVAMISTTLSVGGGYSMYLLLSFLKAIKEKRRFSDVLLSR